MTGAAGAQEPNLQPRLSCSPTPPGFHALICTSVRLQLISASVAQTCIRGSRWIHRLPEHPTGSLPLTGSNRRRLHLQPGDKLARSHRNKQTWFLRLLLAGSHLPACPSAQLETQFAVCFMYVHICLHARLRSCMTPFAVCFVRVHICLHACLRSRRPGFLLQKCSAVKSDPTKDVSLQKPLICSRFQSQGFLWT